MNQSRSLIPRDGLLHYIWVYVSPLCTLSSTVLQYLVCPRCTLHIFKDESPPFTISKDLMIFKAKTIWAGKQTLVSLINIDWIIRDHLRLSAISCLDLPLPGLSFPYF